MVDLKKVKSLMGYNDFTKKHMASYLGISTTAFNNKLNGIAEFKASEIKKISMIFKISMDELYV